MLRIALCQLNYVVGDLEGNARKIIAKLEKAQNEGADIVVFSELALLGYPPYDMVFSDYFVQQSLKYIEEIASHCKTITAIVGGVDVNTGNGKRLFNTAFCLFDGKIQYRYYKSLLPTYDVFDEARYFEPSYKPLVFECKGYNVAVTICEDLWTAAIDIHPAPGKPYYHYDTIQEYKKLQPNVMINIAASPYSYTQISYRYQLLSRVQQDLECPLVYVNQIGANTDIVFDGGSCVVTEKGIYTLDFFNEAYFVLPIEKIKPNYLTPYITESIYEALLLGIRDFFSKNGFSKAVVGLSGGIDSAVVAVLAADALDNDNVHCLLMPSRFSSVHSVKDAIELCKCNRLSYDVVSIESVFSTVEQELSTIFYGKPYDTTEENIQARIRAIFLMAYANKHNYILLNTSNKSELAVGYSTLYGDMCGALSVLGDVYKTQVYELANYLNKNEERIPENIIKKEPSAELRFNQKDTDSLPPYAVLDKLLYKMIEQQMSLAEIIAEEPYDNEVVQKVFQLLYVNEFKRYQAAPVIRVSTKAFGLGRRFPLVKKIK